MRATRRRGAILLVCLAAGVTGCSVDTPRIPEPWPHRPVVDLRFDVADDLTSVEGQENIVFTPDLRTCDVVLRNWPNKPATADAGSSLVVSQVRVDGRTVTPEDVAAGAPPDAPAGTLLDVPLGRCLEAGQRTTVNLRFRLELGRNVDERIGMSPAGDIAWFGTGFPLLAWERGHGWARDDAVDVAGEMAVSEDFRLKSLEVVARSRYAVLGTGEPAGTSAGPRAGTTMHRFAAPAVRDVAVSVGDLQTDTLQMGDTRVHIGRGRVASEADLSHWLAQIRRSMEDLERLLGPFPYQDLWITVLSSESSGIEFPGAIQFGDVDLADRQGLVTHELAHMWFYGLVGNNQGEHPWLDESFATFAQMVADGETEPYDDAAHSSSHPVGGSMSYWAGFRHASRAYYDTVYTVGGSALMAARDRAGPEEFDRALARYLRANAYSIATPDDLEKAFADLPVVLAMLRSVGALT